MTTEETATLEEFLEAEVSDLERQAISQAVGFPASLFKYDWDGDLVRQRTSGQSPSELRPSHISRPFTLSLALPGLSQAPKRTRYV